jgi:hypothetical protein
MNLLFQFVTEKLGRFEKLREILLTFKTYISLEIQVTKQRIFHRFPLFVLSLMNNGRRRVDRSYYLQFLYFDVIRDILGEKGVQHNVTQALLTF